MRKPKKNDAFYRAAIQGVFSTDKNGRRYRSPDTHGGLRSYASGFAAADGYDLRDIDSWTPAQKAKVTKYWNALNDLTARSNYVFRGRNKEHLRIAQEVAQHPPKMPAFKVAFIPFTPPKGEPGFVPELKFTKGTVIVKSQHHTRRYIPFDKEALVENPDAEIKRAISEAGNAKIFTIQAGMYEISTASDKGMIGEHVKRLMAKYDGVTTLTGDKKKDDPAAHDHRRWLNGIIGYKFAPGGGADNVARLQRDMEKAKRELSIKRRNARARMKREGEKVKAAHRAAMHKFGK